MANISLQRLIVIMTTATTIIAIKNEKSGKR
jgi:hypothetical protein